MKTIHLNALNMDVNVLDRSFYSDDGYVENLQEKATALSRIYKPEGKPLTIGPDAKGCAYYFGPVRITDGLPGYPIISDANTHVFSLKQEDELLDLRIRAHEETHALQHMHAIGHLQQGLIRRGSGLYLNRFDKETQACIGGWYALLERYDELPHDETLTWINPDDQIAYEMLHPPKKSWYVRLGDALGI